MAFFGSHRRKITRRTPPLRLLVLEDRTVPAVGIQDAGFETVALPAASFRYNPTGSPWTFNGTSGISSNGSAFTASNPAAPQGLQVALLQQQASITQSVTFAAGTYTLSFSAAERASNKVPETFVVTIDGATVGAFNNVPGIAYTTQTTSSFTVTAGNHTVAFVGTNNNGGDNTIFLDQVSLAAQPAPLNDNGFELPAAAAGTFKYNPSGTPWTYTGTAGVAENVSAFTGSNPNAPQGSQVAFLQQTGKVSQAVNFAAGTYTLSFAAAQRVNFGGGNTFQVLVDGKVVGTYNTLAGGGYTSLTTTSFTVTAGTHTVTFQGTNLNGGDNTAFIDAVVVTQQPTSLNDSGFESVIVPVGGFQYNPAGSAWSFAGTTGISNNGSGFTSGNPVAPQGSQVALVQGTGSISQAVTFAAGSYAISFLAAQRGNGGGPQTLNVLVDGNVVTSFNNLSGTGYSTLTTTGFTVTAGSHVITIQGTNLNGGDCTAFVDQVTVSQVTTGLNDPGFEAIPLGPGGYIYTPAASAWQFAGTAGVSGNNTAFTAGNPVAPQGSQVAFIQQNGTVSQSVSMAAGTYNLSFFAAQRGNVASNQTFQVLVDGGLVGTFNNFSGTGYSTLTTSTFTVTAGSHTITFQGTNLRGGDNTVFVDLVSLNQQAVGLADNGFEAAAVAPVSFLYNPTGTPWTFTGTSGVAANGSAFTGGNAIAPQGSQVLFLQQTGSVSQTATFGAGNFTISFAAARRMNAGGAQTIQVLVDGNVVGTFSNLSGPAYTTLTTNVFTVTAGSHIVTFRGTNSVGDNTAFVDNITFNGG
jgi:hypothetical protein